MQNPECQTFYVNRSSGPCVYIYINSSPGMSDDLEQHSQKDSCKSLFKKEVNIILFFHANDFDFPYARIKKKKMFKLY